ncbi:MAG TPA: ABC transporter permease [candidate division Zixibacteria bacterium]|nr:ABC transporter permease [candidate division Zixibacteria bacterium]
MVGRESRLSGVVFLGALLLLWEAAARSGAADRLLFPPVSRVLETAWSLVTSGHIAAQLTASLKRAAAGYLLAAAFCIPLGILLGCVGPIYRALGVVIEMLRPIPPPVVVPLAMLYLGLGGAMKIFVIFFSCAWPILLNAIDGSRNVDPVILHTARTFGLSAPRTLAKVILPACLPQVMTGLRVSLPITLILVVISEMVGSTDGIGYFILDSQRRFKIDQMYAGMLALALVGYLLNRLFDRLQRAVLWWHWGMMQREAEGR